MGRGAYLGSFRSGDACETAGRKESHEFPSTKVSRMSIIRVGSNAKFADGWEKAFGKSGKGGKSATSKKESKPSPKKAAKKSAKKGKK